MSKKECALHHCDNKRCVNPDHLFLGTKGDNNTDRCKKGRNADRKGVNNTQAKLKPDQVRKIRYLRNRKKYTLIRIAKMFGVTNMAVHAIATYRNWSHIS